MLTYIPSRGLHRDRAIEVAWVYRRLEVLSLPESLKIYWIGNETGGHVRQTLDCEALAYIALRYHTNFYP